MAKWQTFGDLLVIQLEHLLLVIVMSAKVSHFVF